MEVLLDLAGGNPGAITVLTNVMTLHKNEPNKLAYVLSSLSVFNVRGAEIWKLYKDECRQDIALFSKTVCDMLTEYTENEEKDEEEDEEEEQPLSKEQLTNTSPNEPTPPRDEHEEMQLIAQMGFQQYIDKKESFP